MQLTHRIDIAAPPELVWSIWSDVVRWPEWTPSVSSVERLEPRQSEGLSIGLRARVRQPRLPAAVWRVTALEVNRGFTWVSASPGALVTGIHRIEPRADGCRATAELIFSGPVGRLAGLLTRSLSMRYLRMEATGLKARSEDWARDANAPPRR